MISNQAAFSYPNQHGYSLHQDQNPHQSQNNSNNQPFFYHSNQDQKHPTASYFSAENNTRVQNSVTSSYHSSPQQYSSYQIPAANFQPQQNQNFVQNQMISSLQPGSYHPSLYQSQQQQPSQNLPNGTYSQYYHY